MTDCLIFDLFGTLVEYEAGRTDQDFSSTFNLMSHHGASDYSECMQAWEQAFAALDAETADTLQEFHMTTVAERVMSALSIQMPMQTLIDTYIDDWAAGVHAVPGVTGLLTRLSRHYRLALISNTHYPPMVHKLLDEMALTEILDPVVLSVDIGVRKPDTTIFEHTLAKMAVKPAEAVYIGDNYEHDYHGATSAGIDCYLLGQHARVPRDRQLRSILDLAIYFETGRK